MKSDKIKSLFVDFVGAAFILLFAYTAFSKVADFTKFRSELGKSPLLTAFADYVAVLIPVFEILIAVMYFSKRTQLHAMYLSFGLMSAFSTYILIILNYSEYIPCTCGGVLQNMTWTQHLAFNTLFILMALVALLVYPFKEQ